jgi:hypothetical protein
MDEFAAERRASQDAAINSLRPHVQEWLNHPNDTSDIFEVLTQLYLDTYAAAGGQRRGRTAGFLASLRGLVGATEETSNPETVTTWLAVATQNAAYRQAVVDGDEPVVLAWLTMHDDHVRPAHAAADTQRRPAGAYFFVGGENLRYPGDPRGSIENVINCRCVLKPVSRVSLAAANKENPMPLDTPLNWHGVLAPEGVFSGDGRRFAIDSLRHRDLPLPLTWQKASGEGHNGSVVVGRINSIERVDGMMRGEGVFVDTPETDEVVGLLAEFGKFGVSVDADDGEFEFDEDSGQITFTSARIASASLVSIPAFPEAFVALGTWAEADGEVTAADIANAPVVDLTDPDADEECDPSSPDYEDCLAAKGQEPDGDEPMMSAEVFVDEGTWDGSAGQYTPAQWKSACVMHVCTGDEKSCHKLPIKTPGGALSRAGVHAAAARFNQTDGPAEAKASAARALRGAYSTLGEEPPDALKASLERGSELPTDNGGQFGRGPGWLTNPEDTKRLHDYWTVPGHAGYEKVQWGVPGDFYRCRTEVGEEIGEDSPEKLRFINQICSQWHHDATGFWPGHAPLEGGSLKKPTGDPAPAVALVASSVGLKPPAAWFRDPGLDGPTHLTVTEDGRVFGHIAEWRTCHVGYDGVCVAPPISESNYAYYATKQVLCDDGSCAYTGVISLGGGHASPNLGFRAAAAHYDSTSAAVADVSVGEDEHGIWCAGWIRPGTSEEKVVALRASDVSGDWRTIGGKMEMIAALAVNSAGFPIARVENRQQVVLMASGVVHRQEDELSLLITNAISAALHRQVKMAKLRERVGATDGTV